MSWRWGGRSLVQLLLFRIIIKMTQLPFEERDDGCDLSPESAPFTYYLPEGFTMGPGRRVPVPQATPAQRQARYEELRRREEEVRQRGETPPPVPVSVSPYPEIRRLEEESARRVQEQKTAAPLEAVKRPRTVERSGPQMPVWVESLNNGVGVHWVPNMAPTEKYALWLVVFSNRAPPQLKGKPQITAAYLVRRPGTTLAWYAIDTAKKLTPRAFLGLVGMDSRSGAFVVGIDAELLGESGFDEWGTTVGLCGSAIQFRL